MKKNQRALLFLAHGGMELSWRYAWASFLMIAIVHQPFPLPEAIGTFLLAAAFIRVVRGRGLRMISILGLHTIGFLLAASRIIYSLNYRTYPYFDKGWLLAFWGTTGDSPGWWIFAIIMIFTLFFWLAGVAFARRSTAYLSICVRFDYGVAAFFCLFILKSFLLLKLGVEVRDPAPMHLLFSFFIFGLLAVGLARSKSSARRGFFGGYQRVGILLSFTVVVLAFGTGLVLLFMPYLSATAEAGYGVLKSAAGPLVPILERVLFFLFGNLEQQEMLFPSIDRGEAVYIPPGESSWWSAVLGWGLFGPLLLIGLLFCVLGTWYLLRWLFSKKSKEEKKSTHWQLALLWVQRLWAALGTGLKRAAQRLKGYQDAVQLYRAFLKWGRLSGLPHLLSETPAEYGARLQKQFPSITDEIGGIVEAFNLVVYGEVVLDDEQMTRAKLSWKKLRSLKYWPARLKSWFFQEKG